MGLAKLALFMQMTFFKHTHVLLMSISKTLK